MLKSRISPVIQLLNLAYNNANESTAHSWERLNHSMRAALTLAIGSGMPFDEGDVKYVFGHYRSSRWLSDSNEWIYALAIACENKTAIESYEAAVGRTAFIGDDVSFHGGGGYMHGSDMTRKRERLAVGFRFVYRGLKLTVTSFDDAKGTLTACSYRPRTENDYRDKIDKRFKITREDIIADRAERKERSALLKRLTAAAASKTGVALQITNMLGVETNSDYARLPIAKIRKVAEQFLVKE